MKYPLYVVCALVALGLPAMWAVATPGGRYDPFALAGAEIRPVIRSVAAWYRAGPADGRPDWQDARHDVIGGEAALGPPIMEAHGCGTCHVIPGVARARGTVGPSLEGFAERAYVAGVLSNRPGALIDWLMDPVAFSPETAMPDLEITGEEARHVAAYLYTLR